MNKILKQIICRHKNINLLRWHWVHLRNNNDPLTVEAEYICDDCKKVDYLHLNSNKSTEFADTMKDYRRE